MITLKKIAYLLKPSRAKAQRRKELPDNYSKGFGFCISFLIYFVFLGVLAPLRADDFGFMGITP